MKTQNNLNPQVNCDSQNCYYNRNGIIDEKEVTQLSKFNMNKEG